MNRFGHMLDLVLALRHHGIPILALKLTYFTEEEQEWIRAGYAASMSEVVKAARKLEGK